MTAKGYRQQRTLNFATGEWVEQDIGLETAYRELSRALKAHVDEGGSLGDFPLKDSYTLIRELRATVHGNRREDAKTRMATVWKMLNQSTPTWANDRNVWLGLYVAALRRDDPGLSYSAAVKSVTDATGVDSRTVSKAYAERDESHPIPATDIIRSALASR